MSKVHLGAAERTVIKPHFRMDVWGMTHPGLVRDMNESGAKLKLLQDLPVPNSFDLEAVGMPSASCTVVWRRGAELGVRFSEPLERLPSSGASVTPSFAQRPALRKRPA